MMEGFSLEALIAYAKANPVITAVLLLVAVVLIGSLLSKVFKIAVFCAVVLLVGMYFTQGDDSDLWKQVEAIGSEVMVWVEALPGKGRRAVGRGKP